MASLKAKEEKGVGGAYIDGDHVVFGGEDVITGHDLLNGGVGPVEEQAAAVDGPGEVGAEDKVERLVGDGGDVADVDGEVGHEALEGLVAARGARGDGGDGRWIGGAPGVVAHDAGDVVGIEVGGAGRDPAGAQPVVAGAGGGLDDEVDALAHGDGDAVGGVGDDGDEVGADDGQVVAVDGELEVAIGGGIDEADAVLLAGLEDGLVLGAEDALAGVVAEEGAVVRVGAVDEAVLEGRGAAGARRVPEAEGGVVRPVVEEEHAEVLIVVGRRGAVEDLFRRGLMSDVYPLMILIAGGRGETYQAAKQTLGILQREVTVVPGGSILSDLELVGQFLAGSDGTLGHARDAYSIAIC